MIKLLAALLFLSPLLYAKLPEPPLPEGVTGYWVARSMDYNGVEMSIRGFFVSGSLASWTRQFKAHLQRYDDSVVVSEREGVVYLGTADDRWFYTVQLQPDLMGVQGSFSVSSLPGVLRSEVQGVTKTYPQGFYPILEQNNPEGSGFGLEVMATHAGVQGSRDMAVEHFTEQGWQLLSEAEHQLLFRRQQNRLRVFIQRRQGYPGSLMLITREGNDAK